MNEWDSEPRGDNFVIPALPRRSHVLSQDVEGPLAEHDMSYYIGNKTSVRLLNRKYTQEMLCAPPLG